MADDAIELTGIRCYGYTGYLAEERSLGQWFEVDLTLWLDLAAAGHSDRIEDTLDYRATIAAVKELVKTAKFLLVERLAAEIAKTALESGPARKVRVRLTKVAAPIPDFSGRITIDITRDFTTSQ